MDVPAPSVVRGEFVYRDTLLVDVGGDGKRHPRASEAELRALLNGKTPKDQVAHYYEAQLIQYGLQRSKEKNTAKVRLQQALTQGKLRVPPPHIVDMEGQMKKDYASALRKAKSHSKAAMTESAEKSTAKAQKRKNDASESESSKRTKISMNVGDIFINIEHGAAQSSKKATSTKDAKATSKASANSTAKQKNASRTPKGGSSSKSGKAGKADQGSPPPSGKSGPSKARKATAQSTNEGSPPKPALKAKAEPKVSSESKTQAKSSSTVKSEPKVKKEPVIKKASPIKKESKVKQEDVGNEEKFIDNDEPKRRNVTGVYNLICPQLEEQLPVSADNQRMFLCVDGDTVWGGFQLAMKSGVMRTDNIVADEQTSFGWRAKDEWEGGRLSFGRGCFGDIELFGREQIRGTFYNLFNEPMVFEGQRRPGPLWCGRSAYSFQQEWDGFVSQAYGR